VKALKEGAFSINMTPAERAKVKKKFVTGYLKIDNLVNQTFHKPFLLIKYLKLHLYTTCHTKRRNIR